MAISFTPVIYEHAARFVGKTPWEVSRDADLMFEGHRRAYQRYRHQVIAVAIDIYNLEAEAYGSVIPPCAGDDIPSIHRPIWSSFEDGISAPAPDPSRDGRLGMVIGVGRRLKQEFPEADVRIPVAGPFSIAFNLRGISDLCEDALLEPEGTRAMLTRLAENQAPFCRAIAAAGLGVAFFESAAAPPMLSPAAFRGVELPALRKAMEVASEATGRPVPCIMGGNTYPILPDILSTGTRYLVCNIETDQRSFVADVWKTDPSIIVRVNLDPGVVACPDRDRIRAGIDHVLDIVGDRTNCVMGTGAMPLETPFENVDFIRDYLAKAGGV